ncbi:MAG TPA: DUF3826 domain-containing protein [Verrucomicrobiae bacterium]|nr:DUF3826 domain-containing protein [Verrucomicrobiae bacterium]
MKFKALISGILLSTVFVAVSPAQTDNPPVMSTPPLSPSEREALYNRSVENRTQKILEVLKLTDPAKSNYVHAAIVAHYHALRARDEAIDAELANLQKGSTAWSQARVEMFPEMSKPLHDRFVAKLSQDLTPEQIEKVKDKLTYGKVEFTYDAYCQIVPNLTDEEKAKILAWLKQARDEAMDGGSADEKSAVFQQYKEQINHYLDSRGHDVAKAIGEWNEKQELAKKETAESASLTNSFVQ